MVTCYRLEQWKVFFGYTNKRFFCEFLPSGIENICAPGEGGIPQQSFILWNSALRSSSLPFYIFLLIEKVPLPYPVPSIDKWYPFQKPNLELCVTFSCCKCTVFKLWINRKTRKLSRLFHSHKILLLALLGLFTDQNDTDFSTLSCTSTIEILNPFIHLKSGKGTHFAIRTELPRIGHCRGFPLGFMLALLSISMLQNWLYSCVKCLGLYTICEVQGHPTTIFGKISVRKTIWELEFSEHLCKISCLPASPRIFEHLKYGIIAYF